MSAKLCKYECGTMISWDKAKSIFVEPDGTSHSKERCGSLKEKKQPSAESAGGKSTAPVQSTKESEVGIKDLAAAVRELAAAIRSRPI